MGKDIEHNKEELKSFLQWLMEESIARWYRIDEDVGGLGVDKVIEDYLKQKDE